MSVQSITEKHEKVEVVGDLSGQLTILFKDEVPVTLPLRGGMTMESRDIVLVPDGKLSMAAGGYIRLTLPGAESPILFPFALVSVIVSESKYWQNEARCQPPARHMRMYERVSY